MKLYNIQSGACFYCEQQMCLETTNSDMSATVDHIVPKSKGGKKDMFNAVASCRQCNQTKANVSFVQFVYRMKKDKKLLIA